MTAPALVIRDVTPAAGCGPEEDGIAQILRRTLAGEPGVRVLFGLGLPVVGGVERLGTVVVHRGGFVVVRGIEPDGVSCLSGHPDAAERVERDPCRAIIDARRQSEALREHLVLRASSLLRHRLRPATFLAALPVETLVAAEQPARPVGAAVCRTLVLTPQAVEPRVRALMNQPPRRDALGRRLRLRESELATLAEHLGRVHVRPVARRSIAELAVAAFVPA